MSPSQLRPVGINVHLSERCAIRRTQVRALRAPQPPVYMRAHDLPRLLPMWPKELSDLSVAGRKRVIATLRRALKAERQRGLAGHWTYDLARHAQLLAAYRAECAALTAMQRPIAASATVPLKGIEVV
jgi:hypothetical protein